MKWWRVVARSDGKVAAARDPAGVLGALLAASAAEFVAYLVAIRVGVRFFTGPYFHDERSGVGCLVGDVGEVGGVVLNRFHLPVVFLTRNPHPTWCVAGRSDAAGIIRLGGSRRDPVDLWQGNCALDGGLGLRRELLLHYQRDRAVVEHGRLAR